MAGHEALGDLFPVAYSIAISRRTCILDESAPAAHLPAHVRRDLPERTRCLRLIEHMIRSIQPPPNRERRFGASLGIDTIVRRAKCSLNPSDSGSREASGTGGAGHGVLGRHQGILGTSERKQSHGTGVVKLRAVRMGCEGAIEPSQRVGRLRLTQFHKGKRLVGRGIVGSNPESELQLDPGGRQVAFGGEETSQAPIALRKGWMHLDKTRKRIAGRPSLLGLVKGPAQTVEGIRVVGRSVEGDAKLALGAQ